MPRRLFTLASFASLLLFLATAALWLLSKNGQPHFIKLQCGAFQWSTTCYRGRLTALATFGKIPDDVDDPQIEASFSHLGFEYDQNKWGTARQYFVASRLPPLILAFGFLPTVYLLRGRQTVRLDLCPVCSYNLTANTTGICPECGTPLAEKPGV